MTPPELYLASRTCPKYEAPGALKNRKVDEHVEHVISAQTVLCAFIKSVEKSVTQIPSGNTDEQESSGRNRVRSDPGMFGRERAGRVCPLIRRLPQEQDSTDRDIRRIELSNLRPLSIFDNIITG
jgi:hypothetical protein